MKIATITGGNFHAVTLRKHIDVLSSGNRKGSPIFSRSSAPRKWETRTGPVRTDSFCKKVKTLRHGIGNLLSFIIPNDTIENMRNTLKKGLIRNIVFKEDGVWYGVALEFNIVTSGDTPEMATLSLQEAISGYLESLRHSKVGGLRTEAILNQVADPEYEKLWNRLEGNKSIPSPYQVHSFGRFVLPA